jgi:hypothetical protein
MSLILSLREYLFRVIASFTTTADDPVAAPVSEPRRCRFRLDNDSSDILILPDGRKLGYAQYGLLTGRPILYQHGLPGSRPEVASFHELALEVGTRIIAADRPGHGWSSPHPGRTLLDFPKDLECLADHLELDEYCVLVWCSPCFL